LNITNIKSTFGYIGFLPFAIFSLMPWIIGGDISKTLIAFQLGYGAIIITFFLFNNIDFIIIISNLVLNDC